MAGNTKYSPELRAQAVRFVSDEMLPRESHKKACDRLALKIYVNKLKLYAWVKAAAPPVQRPESKRGRLRCCAAHLAICRKKIVGRRMRAQLRKLL